MGRVDDKPNRNEGVWIMNIDTGALVIGYLVIILSISTVCMILGIGIFHSLEVIIDWIKSKRSKKTRNKGSGD
jgi:uncharacterized membrane-anchored protein